MARMGPLAKLGSRTPWGKSAGAKAMNMSMPAGMRGPIGPRMQNRNAAFHKAGKYTVMGGAVATAGMMTSGRSSSSQRGGYSPPRLREPRGSGRYA
jgi:hypothetical protein